MHNFAESLCWLFVFHLSRLWYLRFIKLNARPICVPQVSSRINSKSVIETNGWTTVRNYTGSVGTNRLLLVTMWLGFYDPPMMTSWHGNVFCITGFVRGIHRWPVDSPHKVSVMQTFVFFVDSLNVLYKTQSGFRWFATPYHSWDVIIMGDSQRLVQQWKCW